MSQRNRIPINLHTCVRVCFLRFASNFRFYTHHPTSKCTRFYIICTWCNVLISQWHKSELFAAAVVCFVTNLRPSAASHSQKSHGHTISYAPHTHSHRDVLSVHTPQLHNDYTFYAATVDCVCFTLAHCATRCGRITSNTIKHAVYVVLVFEYIPIWRDGLHTYAQYWKSCRVVDNVWWGVGSEFVIIIGRDAAKHSTNYVDKSIWCPWSDSRICLLLWNSDLIIIVSMIKLYVMSSHGWNQLLIKLHDHTSKQ